MKKKGLINVEAAKVLQYWLLVSLKITQEITSLHVPL
jgi:beta-lactamase class D